MGRHSGDASASYYTGSLGSFPNWVVHTQMVFFPVPSIHKIPLNSNLGLYPHSDSSEKSATGLFYLIWFLASWLRFTCNSAQKDLTDATARAYINRATKK